MMSSISGEIGLPFRVPYCSSKFAITGFFEALRTELEDFNVGKKIILIIAITIVCPPSVRSPMRDHDLLKRHIPIDESSDRITVEECVKTILDAADRRARKVVYKRIIRFFSLLRLIWLCILDLSSLILLIRN